MTPNKPGSGSGLNSPKRNNTNPKPITKYNKKNPRAVTNISKVGITAKSKY